MMNYNKFKEEEFMRWEVQKELDYDIFVNEWKKEINEKLYKVALPYISSLQDYIWVYTNKNEKLVIEETVNNLQLENLEPDFRNLMDTISKFFNTCMFFPVKEILLYSEKLKIRENWLIKYLICSIYDLCAYREEKGEKRLRKFFDALNLKYLDLPKLPFFNYPNFEIGIRYIDSLGDILSVNESFSILVYLLCIDTNTFSCKEIINHLKEKAGKYELDLLLTKIIWHTIAGLYPFEDIFGKLAKKYNIENSYLKDILNNNRYKKQREFLSNLTSNLDLPYLKYFLIWYLPQLSQRNIFKILYISSQLSRETSQKSFFTTLIVINEIVFSTILSDEFTKWLRSALTEEDLNDFRNFYQEYNLNEVKLKPLLYVTKLKSNVYDSLFNHNSLKYDSLFPEEMEVKNYFQHLQEKEAAKTFSEWLKSEFGGKINLENCTEPLIKYNLSLENGKSIRGVKPIQFIINEGIIKFNDHKIISSKIKRVPTEVLDFVEREFAVWVDFRDKKNKRFWFHPLEDMYWLINKTTELSKIHQEIILKDKEQRDIIAQDIPASDFIVKDGQITYKFKTLKSVRINTISPDILKKIEHRFTIKKDGSNDKFIFIPPTDLSLLIAEGERLKDTSNSQSSSLFPSDGEFELPWKYVLFYDNIMYLTHPNTSKRETVNPFYFKHPNLKRSFRDILPYIETHCPKFIVSSKDYIISSVRNFQEFEKQIPFFNEFISSNEMETEFIPQSVKSAHFYTKDKFINYNWVKKSSYLYFLSKRQVDDQKIYHLLETKIHSASDFWEEEEGYLFTIFKSPYTGVLIYENTTDESRSSILFYVNPKEINNAINEIRKFFGSDIENKREKLALGHIKFPSKLIRSYKRIKHSEINEWKYKIRELLSQLF